MSDWVKSMPHHLGHLRIYTGNLSVFILPHASSWSHFSVQHNYYVHYYHPFLKKNDSNYQVYAKLPQDY